MITTVTSKGQVTLPQKLRNKLKLHSGDKIEFFFAKDGSVQLIPITAPVTQLKGMVPKPKKSVSLKQMKKAIQEGATGS